MNALMKKWVPEQFVRAKSFWHRACVYCAYHDEALGSICSTILQIISKNGYYEINTY